MREPISYKKFFMNYGIFVGILAVLMGLLVYVTKITQRSWSKNLRKSVELVLDETEPSTWFVTNELRISNAFTLSAACYEARNKKDGQIYKAVIISTQTIYGPIPSVFTVDKDGQARFMGYSNVHGRVQNQLMSDTSNKRIQYWTKKIPYIIGS